jgi:two-component system KDP operon response regulator KdpE
VHTLIATADARAGALLAAHIRVLWPDDRPDRAADARGVARHQAAGSPDLILLDLALPPGGLAALRTARAVDADALILACGRVGTAVEEVAALDAGADAYLPAAANTMRLLAHLRALARRAAPPAPPARVPGLMVDLGRCEARLDGAPLSLTPTEYMLLAALAARPGETVPHRALLARVWGAAHADRAGYLKSYINRLRARLGDEATRPRHIRGYRGVGYRLLDARVVAA